MNGSLYTGASGLSLAGRRLELVANNLANGSTAAFRPLRAHVETQASAERTSGTNRSVALAGTWENRTPGPLRATGEALDVALLGEGVFAVETVAGLRYTRSGAFRVDGGGMLVDAAGNAVLNPAAKPIRGLTAAASISGDGRVMEGGEEIGRLRVVSDPAGVLRRAGGNLLDAGGADGRLRSVDPQLRVGWLEDSGTDPVQELIRLLEAQRAFERLQRVISVTANEINRRAVNEIAGT